jgi:hypothetical protein
MLSRSTPTMIAADRFHGQFRISRPPRTWTRDGGRRLAKLASALKYSPIACTPRHTPKIGSFLSSARCRWSCNGKSSGRPDPATAPAGPSLSASAFLGVDMPDHGY